MTGPSSSPSPALRWTATTRSRRPSGTTKEVSSIPSGSKMRRRRNSSNGCPEATSTTRARASIPARPLYRQRVPGWKSSGRAAKRDDPLGQRRPRPARPEQLRRRLLLAEPAAGQAGGVRQQVANRDLALRRDELDLPVLLDGDLHPLELGDEPRDGVGQADLALLDQHQDRHARDRLGRGGHAEDRVRAHRRLRLDVHHAPGLVVDDAPPAGDQGDGPRDLLLLDVPPDDLVDPIQALRRDPHLLRPGAGQSRWFARPRRQKGHGQEDEEKTRAGRLRQKAPRGTCRDVSHPISTSYRCCRLPACLGESRVRRLRETTR